MTGCHMTKPGLIAGALTLDHVAPDSEIGIDNNVRPTKKGVATSTAILFYVTGDGSIDAAMKNGGITKVHHVDYDVKNILGIVSEVKTIVYGE